MESTPPPYVGDVGRDPVVFILCGLTVAALSRLENGA